MRKRVNFIILTISFFVLLIQIQPVSAIPITVKSFNTQNFNRANELRDRLLDPGNFGPSGIVQDIIFDFENVSAITPEHLAGADIFVAGFPYEGTTTISSSEAQLLRDYVTQGGSLIVTSDEHPSSRNSANAIGAPFGIGFSEGPLRGELNIIDRDAAPEITDGPFGEIKNLQWTSNGTSKMLYGGVSTMIDDVGMISVLTPTATSGSIVFFGDSDLFYDSVLGWPHYTGDWDALRLNVFAYSANSSRINNPIPEPATMAMFGLGLLGLAGIGRRKTSQIQN